MKNAKNHNTVEHSKENKTLTETFPEKVDI